MTRILVCGGREFNDKNFVFQILDSFDRKEVTHVISGMARGADSLGAEWAIKHNVTLLQFPALWNVHGKKAGPIRNQQMLDEGKPDLVLAFPGGEGTADMVARSHKAGVRVFEIKSA